MAIFMYFIGPIMSALRRLRTFGRIVYIAVPARLVPNSTRSRLSLMTDYAVTDDNGHSMRYRYKQRIFEVYIATEPYIMRY